MVTTNPNAGLLEENNEKLQKKLAEKKDSMSMDEINALVEKTKEFNEWTNEESDQSVINSLKAVNAKDIPVEVKDYNIKDTEEQGIREISGNIDIPKAEYINFVFDESHLTSEELLYLQFYAAMITKEMPTKTRTLNEVQKENERKSMGISASIDVISDSKDGSKAHPVFDYLYFTINDYNKDMLNISSDILLNSNLEDCDRYVRNTINSEKEIYDAFISEPSQLALLRAASYDNMMARYENYLCGIDYNDFISNLEKDYNENPQKVIDKIKEVREKAFNKNNITVEFAGNDESKNIFNKELNNFTDKLNNKTYEKVSYDLPIPAKREALITNSDVQYVTVNSSLNNLNISAEGKYYVLTKLLNEKYFVPQLRLKGGAYDAECAFDDNNYLALTFRDSDFKNSLKVIDSTAEYMKDFGASITEEELDNYIISTYAD